MFVAHPTVNSACFLKAASIAAFFLFSAPSFADKNSCLSETLIKAQTQKLAENPQWLRLLHFRRTFPFFESEADGKNFFISPKGNKDPGEELKADLEALCSGEPRLTGDKNQKELSASCQFPARAKFLSKSLGYETPPWPQPACPSLETWRQRLNPESVSLVFSSYYPNSPSSVFGHTLLRMNRRATANSTVTSPLLSYGINYAATTNTNNAIKYALWGLAGGFPGEFSALPYYYKVREYSDVESRDLWEYQLNLSHDEIGDLVDHLWELAFTHFNYYYFTENCSYHLLTALEGAVPRLHLSNNVPWWVIPVDSVKAVAESPGLVSGVSYRPSLYRTFLAREARMNGRPPAERFFSDLIRRESFASAKEASPEDQVRALDAALDFWDFKHYRDLTDPKSPESKFKHEMLVARAALPASSQDQLDIQPPGRPDQGHPSMRYGLGAGHSNADRRIAALDLRFAFHDFLDPQQGLPETSSIDFFHVRGRAYDDLKKFEVDYVRLVDVQLISPLARWNKPTAWHFAVGAERLAGFGCDHCLAPMSLMQGGASLPVFTSRILFYGLAGGRAAWNAGSGQQAFVLGPQANLGLRLRFTANFLAQSELQWAHGLGPNLSETRLLTAETRYSPSIRWSVGVKYIHERDIDEATLSIYHYR